MPPLHVVDLRSGANARGPVMLSGPTLSGGLFNSTTTIRRGMCGQLVRGWQELLRHSAPVRSAHGTVAVDGVFGSETEAATKTLQANLGVRPDGVVGPKTLAAARKRATSNGGTVDSTPSFTAGPCTSSDPSAGGRPTGNAAEQDGGGGDQSLLDLIVEHPVISVSIGVLAVVLIRGNRSNDKR